VLDLAEVPFIREKRKSTVITKLRVSDDHGKVAFSVDIGNTERQTVGIRDMVKGSYSHFHIENVCQCEFGASSNILFYTETDDANRPGAVKMIDLDTNKTTTVFVDDDPTHYIDLGVTKDKNFLIIASNTKEDSEIWILPRDPNTTEVITPVKLINRVPEVKAHIDHVRDFFITITNDEDGSYRIKTLKDDQIGRSHADWQDLLDPKLFTDSELVITEFDCFSSFVVLYCKVNGKPDILIHDLDSHKTTPLNVTPDVGEISPMVNDDYNATSVDFMFNSPFIYQ
jgi:protease II